MNSEVKCVPATSDFSLAKVGKPEQQPSKTGAPSVQTPITRFHFRLCSSKNLFTKLKISLAVVLLVRGLQTKIHPPNAFGVFSVHKHILQLNLQHPWFHQAELRRSQTLTPVSLTPPATKCFPIVQIFS